MSGCCHMSPDDFCLSCAPERAQRFRAEQAELERDEARAAKDMHKERYQQSEERATKLQADLDAALDCLDFHLGKLPLDCCPGCNGSGMISREAPGDEECPYGCRGEWPTCDTKRVGELLEKRKEARRG